MLKQEEWGFTNPVVSDLYGKPPLVWKDMDIHLVVYETDIENIEKVIPEPLEARTNKVFVWQSHFDLGTTQGAFSETAIYVQVKYKDYEADYEPFLYVDSHLPLTAGRSFFAFIRSFCTAARRMRSGRSARTAANRPRSSAPLSRRAGCAIIPSYPFPALWAARRGRGGIAKWWKK